MDAKQRKHSNSQDDDTSSSGDVAYTGQRRHVSVEQSGGEPGGEYYDAYLASLSDEFNTGGQHPLPASEQPVLEEERWESRRFGFRRCRKHRREEMQQLQEEKHRLILEAHQLSEEKARLQEELRREISLANNVGNNEHIATRAQGHEAQRGNQSQLSQLLQYQRQTRGQYLPGIIVPADPSIASFPQMMPIAAASVNESGTSNRQQNTAIGRGMFQIPRTQGQLQSEISYLHQFQGTQETAATLRYPNQSPPVAPQMLLSPRAIMERRIDSSQGFANINASPKNPPRPSEPGARRHHR